MSAPIFNHGAFLNGGIELRGDFNFKAGARATKVT